MERLPSRLSRPSPPHFDNSSGFYPPLPASESSPLPCRPRSTFIRSDPARSDPFPVLCNQLPVHRQTPRHTLIQNTLITHSLRQKTSPLAQPCLLTMHLTSKSFGSNGDHAGDRAPPTSNFSPGLQWTSATRPIDQPTTTEDQPCHQDGPLATESTTCHRH
jgi:hypothetical protein